MRISSLPAVAGLLFTALIGAAPAAAFVPAGVTPARITTPGVVDFRFTVQGVDQDGSVQFRASSLSLEKDAFSGPISTARVTGVRTEGATLTPVGISSAMLVAGCRRGGELETSWTTYRLDVPAKATATVIVSALVPAGLPGRRVGVEISHGLVAPSGQALPGMLNRTSQLVERDAYVDGISLKAKKAKGGRYVLSGRVIPARRGAKLSFVSRAASTPEAADAVFGMPESVLSPKKGLSTVGTTRTTKGGRFTTTLKLKPGTAVAARTAGAHAGASCGTLIR